MIQFPCPTCQTVFKVNDEKAGKKGKCPNCQSPFTIPQPEAAAVPTPKTDPNLPVEIEPCPGCGAILTVAAEFLGADVECPNCNSIFTSTQPGTKARKAPATPKPPTVEAISAFADLGDGDDVEEERAPKKKGKPSVVEDDKVEDKDVRPKKKSKAQAKADRDESDFDSFVPDENEDLSHTRAASDKDVFTDADGDEGNKPIRKKNKPNAMGRVLNVINMIIDFRFQRYLTPYILRLFWLLALIGSLLGLFTSTFVTPFSDTVEPSARVGLDSPRARPIPATTKEVKEPSELSQAFGKIIVWFMQTGIRIVGTLMALMLFRVMAELAIVVFNISKDLKSLNAMQAVHSRSNP